MSAQKQTPGKVNSSLKRDGAISPGHDTAGASLFTTSAGAGRIPWTARLLISRDVLQLQRTIGNRATRQLLTNTKTSAAQPRPNEHPGTLSVIQPTGKLDDLANVNEVQAGTLINQFDPFDAATNLYVYANGQPFKAFILQRIQPLDQQGNRQLIETANTIPDVFQSQGQGPHAEYLFKQWLEYFQNYIPDNTNILLQINKSPCGACAPNVIVAMKKSFPNISFRLEMVGIYPGNHHNQGTSAQNLTDMLDAGIDLDILDIQPIINKVRLILDEKLNSAINQNIGRKNYRNTVQQWRQKLSSYRNGLNDSIERLGNRVNQTNYEQKLNNSLDQLNTQITYLTNSWDKWGNGIGQVIQYKNILYQARSDYKIYGAKENIEYIERQIQELNGNRADITSEMTDEYVISKLNQEIDLIITEFQKDLEKLRKPLKESILNKRRTYDHNSDDENEDDDTPDSKRFRSKSPTRSSAVSLLTDDT